MTSPSVSGDIVARVYARLTGLKESLPDRSSIPERYVQEYHDALKPLTDAGLDLAEFMVPPQDVGPVVAGGNYATGEVRYSREHYVTRGLFLAKLSAILTYFSMGGEERRRIGFDPER